MEIGFYNLREYTMFPLLVESSLSQLEKINSLVFIRFNSVLFVEILYRYFQNLSENKM